MPPRRGRAKKSEPAAPKVEEPVKAESPTPDPEPETTPNVSAENVENETPENQTGPSTPLDRLEKLSDPDSLTVLTILTVKMNQPNFRFQFTNEEVTAKTDTTPLEYNISGHFMNHCYSLGPVTCSKNTAKNIIADLLLKKVYGKAFTSLVEHEGMKGTYTVDKEYYEAAKTKSLEYLETVVVRRKLNEEKKVEFMERNTLTEVVVPFEKIMSNLENCYYSPFCATCMKNGLDKEVVYTQLKSGKDTEFDFKENNNLSALETGNDIMYRVRIDASKEGVDPIAFEAESADIFEARSAAAFNCLKQLLEDGTVTNWQKDVRAVARQQKAKKERNAKADKRKRTEQETKQAKQAKGQNNVMMGGQQCMMMPCMMGPNGQYMMCMPQGMDMTQMMGMMGVGGQMAQQNRKPNNRNNRNRNNKGKKKVVGENGEAEKKVGENGEEVHNKMPFGEGQTPGAKKRRRAREAKAKADASAEKVAKTA